MSDNERSELEQAAIDATSAFYDAPQTLAQGARSAIKAARNTTSHDVVKGMKAAEGFAGMLGDGLMEGGRMVGVGAKALANQTADQYNAAKPYLAAAGKGAAGGLQNMAGNIATSAGQLYDQVPTVRGETQDFGAIPRAMNAAGDYIRNDLGSDLRSVGNALNPTPSAPPAYQLLRDMKGYAQPKPSTGNQPIAFGNAQLPAAGAQGGASSTTADNIADQMAGVKKPEDAFSPVTEGAGINIQAKAMQNRANQSTVSGNTAYDVITNPVGQAEAAHNNYQEGASRDNYNNAMGFNSPDTAPTRLPSVETGTPQGGLGAGNAIGAAATGRTTGDGSSDPNSPNFQPVGLGGVPIQSAGEWMAQRAAEKQEVYNRRAASNAKDRSRMQQEGRQALFEKAVRDLPDNLTNRTKSITALYNSIMGDQVTSEGQDKTVQVANQRNRSEEAMAATSNRAAAQQNAFKNMMDQSNAEADAVKAQRDEAHKQARLGQYQAGINATAGKNAWQQRKAEYDVGFARAKNQREALAAQRAGLKLASDMDVQSVGLPQLGGYQGKLNAIADLSGYSDEQMAQFRAENPQLN